MQQRLHALEGLGFARGQVADLGGIDAEIVELVAIELVDELPAAGDDGAAAVADVAVDDGRGVGAAALGIGRAGAGEQVGERPAVHHREGRRDESGELEHGGAEVGEADRLLHPGGRDAGPADDERHPDLRVVQIRGVEGLAVFAERLAVIAGDDDDGLAIGRQAGGGGHHLADPAIDLAEQVVVVAAPLRGQVGVAAGPLVQLDEVHPGEGRRAAGGVGP